MSPRKKTEAFTVDEHRSIREALAVMDANYQSLAAEARKLAALEGRKPVEMGQRWRVSYTLLEEQMIREVRRALAEEGMSQASLARNLGVSRARVSQVLNGEDENFQMETIAKLATALDRDVEIRLIRRDEEVVVRRARRRVGVKKGVNAAKKAAGRGRAAAGGKASPRKGGSRG